MHLSNISEFPSPVYFYSNNGESTYLFHWGALRSQVAALLVIHVTSPWFIYKERHKELNILLYAINV